MNVKAHIRAQQDSQSNHTDGGALCDASCSASSFDLLHQTVATSVFNGSDRMDLVMALNGGVNVYVSNSQKAGTPENPVRVFYIKPEHWKVICSGMIKK